MPKEILVADIGPLWHNPYTWQRNIGDIVRCFTILAGPF